jgi:hypothetical protein
MISGGGRRRTFVLARDRVAMVVLTRGGVEVASWPLAADAPLDLSVLDDLARLQLAARRLGCTVHLRGACAELTELLAFVGLAEVVALQVGGEAEEGEQRGVEEVVVTDDPVA